MLTLQHMPLPGNNEIEVVIFRDWQSAWEHLAAHVLSSPECFAWALLLPEKFGDMLESSTGRTRDRLVREGLGTEGDAVQDLYNAYAAATRATAACADAIGWFKTQDGVTVAFGVLGILVIAERGAVSTAYIPGQGSAEVVERGRQEAAAANHPVRNSQPRRQMRNGRPVVSSQKHEEKWSRREKIFYRVFRPALNWLIAQQPDPDCVGTKKAYLWLKPLLQRSRRSFRTYDVWVEHYEKWKPQEHTIHARN